MAAEQLDLLWSQLQSARLTPETMDLAALLNSVDSTIAQLPESLQMQVAGEVMLQVAQLFALRAEVLIENWEDSYRDPVVSKGFFSDLVRQTMAVDFSDLLEPTPPRKRRSKSNFKVEFSIAAPVDKSAVMAMVEELEANSEVAAAEPPLSDEDKKQKAMEVAHDEDVSAWVGAISNYFALQQMECLPLVELVQKVQYSDIEKKDRGSPLVKTWLAALLGGLKLEQGQDFYDLESIRVWMPSDLCTDVS